MDPFNLIIILAGAALVPFLAVVATSYIKIAVVLMLVRNALGVQQIPPNIALNALAIILTGYVMAPVAVQTYDILTQPDIEFATIENIENAYDRGKVPIIEFFNKHADERERSFFLRATNELWPPELSDRVNENSLAIMLPAFTVTQLREAFEIGFLLYLPFIVIDLIVSNILLAMGMMMVSPLTISLPFKLFLFVTVDGWSRLLLGLVKTYT